MTFWTSSELDTYIAEALRWWGLTAMYFRQTGRITTVPGQAFYDIPTHLEDNFFVPLQDFHVTDRAMINDVCYQLMEPPIVSWPGGWIGTEMFTLEEITQLLEASRDDLLKMTGLLAYELIVPWVPTQTRLEMPVDTVIQIPRTAVRPVDQDPVPIWAGDNIQVQTTISDSWLPKVNRPKAFSVNYTPQLSIDLWPAPITSGEALVYATLAGDSFFPRVTDTIFGLPDDICFVAKYRALEDLLSGDGLNRAWKLSEYCHQRVIHGLDAIANYLSFNWAESNGRKTPITSLAQLDQSRPKWQSTPGRPKSVHQLTWNLIAMYPVPDDKYILTFDAVRKAPIPETDGDFIQVGRESLQALLDYAQHIASFKMQGGEFDATLALYQSAHEAAMDYRAQILAQSKVGGRQIGWQTQMDRWSRPYRARALSDSNRQEVATHG